MAGGADDLGLVAFDRRDRSVDAERRRLDRVACRERAGERQRLVELPDRALRRDGSLARRRRAGGRAPARRGGCRRASRISSRSASSSARAAARSRCASAAARSRSAAAEALTAAISSSSSCSARRARTLSALDDLGALRLRRRPLLDGRPLGRLRLGEQLLDPEPLRRDQPARGLDDARVEPEPLGDLERVRRPRPPERDAIERRVRVGIEAGARVRDALGRARPLLQLRVMGRHERQPRLLGEPRHERLRERGALDGIRARGELVEEDERALAGGVQDRDDARDVAREGREAHLDRLPVADVREHLVEDGQRGRLGRRAQPRLMQQRGEPERLQRDRLAARVRAADHERAQAAEVEVDRHGGLGSSSGWRAPRAAPRPRPRRARRSSRARACRARSRGRSRPSPRPRRSASERRLADGGRQLAQDPLDLLALGARRLRLAVARARRRRTARRRASGRSRRRRGRCRARCGARSP